MPLPLKFASRYLFAKRSVNVINLVTALSVLGLAVGSAAVVLVLSVFNGFEEVIAEMFGRFNPAVKVVPAHGKTFPADALPLDRLRGFPGVEALALSLEETAFFEYGDSRAFGRLRGVDSNYAAVSAVDETLVEGEFALRRGQRALGVIGIGLRNKLGVNTGSGFDPIQVYAANRKQRGPFDRPFLVRSVYPVATFAIQQDYDQQYLLTDLRTARELLQLPGAASAVELRVDAAADVRALADDLGEFLGDGYVVLDRFEQDAELLRLMNVEKWLSYVILSLVLLLVSFNLVGGLWLIVVEKERDIGILRAMGATRATIGQIFFLVGLQLSGVGALLGLALAGALYFLQVTYGIVPVPEGLVVSAYPIRLRPLDVAVVFATVLAIGGAASWPAARRAARGAAT